MGKESKIEGAVCSYAENKRFYQRKFVSPGHRGVPDRLFITPNGVVFFIEFKAPGEEMDPLQRYEARQIENRGPRVHTVDSVEAGKRMIDFYAVQPA